MYMPDGQVIRRAFAKVNLALAVSPPIPPGQPRAGWHEIASWMATIDLADEVAIRRLDPGATSTFAVRWFDGSPVPWDVTEDLTVKAHRALQAAAGRMLPVEIVVHKRIPAGGGLGGGSADAACVLVGLDELYGLNLGGEGLRAVATSIGSDVPFFIDRVGGAGDGASSDDSAQVPQRSAPPRPAYVTRFGDRIERLETRPKTAIVLVVPPFGCATAEVYRTFDSIGPGPLQAETVRRLADVGEPDGELLFNDLAEAAEAVAPAIGELRRSISAAIDRPVHVSGSGSSIFVVAPSVDEAEELSRPVVEACARIGSGCRVEPVRLL